MVYLVELQQETYESDPWIERVMSDEREAVAWAFAEAIRRGCRYATVYAATVNGAAPEQVWHVSSDDYPITPEQEAGLAERFTRWLTGVARSPHPRSIELFITEQNHFPHYLPENTSKKFLMARFVEGGVS